MNETKSTFEYDVFICHASADKEAVVRPLCELLDSVDITVWLDEKEIDWGDSIVSRIEQGLSRSRFVIVVVSPSFSDREWPRRELGSALQAEIDQAESRVLPLWAGSEKDFARMRQSHPLLSDKQWLTWPSQQDKIVDRLLKKLDRPVLEVHEPSRIDHGNFDIPLPNIKSDPTQRDRDRFLRDGFETILTYFESGLGKLEGTSPGVQTDFEPVDAKKFVASVYIDGDLKCRCTIWRGNFASASEQILYSEGTSSFGNDQSCNDWLSVSRDELVWETSGLNIFMSNQRKRLSTEEAARYLWERFIAPLERRQ